MKNMPHKFHISALIAMLLMPASLFAQEVTLPAPPERPEHHPDWRHVPEGTGNPLQALTKRLNLSVDQQARIQPIIQGTLPVLKQIRDEEKARMGGAIDTAANQIRSVLNDDQKAEFERIVDQLKSGPPGPHGPPPPPRGHHGPPPGEPGKGRDSEPVSPQPAASAKP